jgi:hypothetical protein
MVADKSSGYGSGIQFFLCFLDPWNEHPVSYFRELRSSNFQVKILKFFVADLDTGSGIILTLDLGSGIRDPV